MIIFWLILIGIVSLVWAFISLIREKNKKEIDSVREEINKGRVIFQSSDSSGSL